MNRLQHAVDTVHREMTGMSREEAEELQGEGRYRWPDPPAVPEEDEHDEFPCILCGGVVRWRYGDYYCQKCDVTYEIDGRICKEGAK